MSYQIQQYIAAAVESVLASGQSYVATANIQKNRDDTTSTVPRYEIEVGNVARASMQMMSVPTVGLVYNHFTADATVALVTERGSSINHAAAVARTRYLFSQEAQAFVSPVVTAFEVLMLEPTAEAQDVNEEAREDWSRLSFRFEIGLVPGAYQVPPTGFAVLVAGAGTSAINGLYRPVDTFGGKTRYYLNGDTSSFRLVWETTQWEIQSSDGLIVYYNSGGGENPWTNGDSWATDDGLAPAPTVSESIGV